MRFEAANLRKTFGKMVAVDGISFSFASGEVIGFVGPNGAGKTTTMRMLATLDEPTSGDAFIDGVSVVQEPEEARRLLGFVPDALPTHHDITVHEYLDFFARAYRIESARRKKTLDSIEEFTNLIGIRHKTLKSLSKGMNQRVCLARALLHDPKVLILDEPAAGLDPRARIELRELIRVFSSQGKAILMSSHILTELSEICTGAVIIERGRVLKAGKLDDLLVRDEATRTIVIRALTAIDALHRSLLEMPGTREVRVDDDEVTVDYTGSDTEASELLAELIRRGHRIAEFRQQRANLEQLFMDVTTGGVQ
ncbi:MAG TPA: ABC transporter ATP-binding protein [Thermoanaerobaculia bacterium]|nr:ABC transporter ATP-binding protein [Thermoanaerobaculia bacterium]